MDATDLADAKIRNAERITTWRPPMWRAADPNTGRKSLAVRGHKVYLTRPRYRLHGYDTYRANRLRADYSELEMHLRSVCENYADETWFDHGRAEQAVDILECARAALEQEDPNVDVVDDDLGRARRLLVWLSPKDWIATQTTSVSELLSRSGAPESEAIKLDPSADARHLRFRLDEAIGVLNQIWKAKAVNQGLQLRRLVMVRNLGIAAVSVLVLFAPVLLNSGSIGLWRLGSLSQNAAVSAWLTTAATAAMGTTGALLSGLLQARDRPVTFADYQVRGIELALRALVGAMVSIVLYFLLSWEVLPVVVVVNAGTFLLVAFVSGFSERYFLKVLGLENTATTLPPASLTPGAPPTKTPPSEG